MSRVVQKLALAALAAFAAFMIVDRSRNKTSAKLGQDSSVLEFENLVHDGSWESSQYELGIRVRNVSQQSIDLAITPDECCGRVELDCSTLHLKPGQQHPIQVRIKQLPHCNAKAMYPIFTAKTPLTARLTVDGVQRKIPVRIESNLRRSVIPDRLALDFGRVPCSIPAKSRVLKIAAANGTSSINVKSRDGRFDCVIRTVDDQQPWNWLVEITPRSVPWPAEVRDWLVITPADSNGNERPARELELAVDFMSDIVARPSELIVGSAAPGTVVAVQVHLASAARRGFRIDAAEFADGDPMAFTANGSIAQDHMVKLRIPIREGHMNDKVRLAIVYDDGEAQQIVIPLLASGIATESNSSKGGAQ